MKYCLDTNIIIDVFRGDETLQKKLSETNFCTNPLVLAELFKGAYRSKQTSGALELVQDFADNTEVLQFSKKACDLFGNLHTKLRKKGKEAPEIDLMIGCIAKAHNAILVTRNPKDFKHIEGLKVEVW